ncbi:MULTISPECIES: hypothetical protein [unclassified Mycobacterium]|uniref:hypothetical protein n=1 Tax=unclassified Mycobacterium TaxID=2642494 RepID=UPI0029C8FD13|nr:MULTISPECIES: hypothetical protein [unclassified Mycobacterium]
MAGLLRRLWLLSAGVATVPMAACGQSDHAIESSATAPATTITTTTTAVAALAPPGPRTVKWVDLGVGDCVAAVPAVEFGEVTAELVDCATPHQAEVYLLAPIAVNAAITDVANQECAAGLTPYAGQSAGTTFTVTYLIDSRQDRTSNNPLPSTVICLLQAADGQPLIASARG